MSLDTAHDYVYRIGSDNQHRLHWDGKAWNYEFLAGGVLFDHQTAAKEDELNDILFVHGLTLEQFKVDEEKSAASYSSEIKNKIDRLSALGIVPCPKHGLTAKNEDNTCEACNHTDYPDDFKGTEG